MEDKREIVRKALADLLARENDDAFVIFKYEAANKFVQFVGSTSEPLLLNLYAPSLSEEELGRAKTFFKEFDTEIAGKDFFLELGQDTEKAADIVIRIFSEINQLPPDFEMNVKEE